MQFLDIPISRGCAGTTRDSSNKSQKSCKKLINNIWAVFWAAFFIPLLWRVQFPAVSYGAKDDELGFSSDGVCWEQPAFGEVSKFNRFCANTLLFLALKYRSLCLVRQVSVQICHLNSSLCSSSRVLVLIQYRVCTHLKTSIVCQDARNSEEVHHSLPKFNHLLEGWASSH